MELEEQRKKEEKTAAAVSYGAVEDGGDDLKKGAPPSSSPPASEHSVVGILFIMLGAFSFSIMFLLVKLMQGTANAFTLVFYRSLVQIAISLGTLLYHKEPLLGPPEARFWLIIRGSFGATAVIAWFFGIQNLALPDAVVLQFTTPPFAAAFAVCFAGERWLGLDMIGAVVCLMGVALIAHPTWLFGSEAADDASDGDESGPGAFMKALAVGVTTMGAAMAGIAYVSVRMIGDRASAVVMVLYYAVLSIPIVLIGSRWLEGKWNVWGYRDEFSVLDYFLMLLTGFAGYGGQFFTNLGLQKESAATATLATSTQIVWTYVFELLFLHEPLNKWSLAGTGLILGYMLFVGHIKLKAAAAGQEHEVVAGETEETALLHASERPRVTQSEV